MMNALYGEDGGAKRRYLNLGLSQKASTLEAFYDIDSIFGVAKNLQVALSGFELQPIPLYNQRLTQGGKLIVEAEFDDGPKKIEAFKLQNLLLGYICGVPSFSMHLVFPALSSSLYQRSILELWYSQVLHPAILSVSSISTSI